MRSFAGPPSPEDGLGTSIPWGWGGSPPDVGEGRSGERQTSSGVKPTDGCRDGEALGLETGHYGAVRGLETSGLLRS